MRKIVDANPLYDVSKYVYVKYQNIVYSISDLIGGHLLQRIL